MAFQRAASLFCFFVGLSCLSWNLAANAQGLAGLGGAASAIVLATYCAWELRRHLPGARHDGRA